MPLVPRYSKTATGKACVAFGPECESDAFPARAQEIAERFGLVVDEKIDGLDERLWIVRKDNNTFCISWDIWIPEVSIMAWESTPESAIVHLISGA
jgi:hypothetical protein